MKFNKDQYKNIRIFHNPQKEDFEYFSFGIDVNNYLTFRRSIYNTTTKEDMYLVDWLQDQEVDYIKLDFKEYDGKQPEKKIIEENVAEFEREFIERINQSMERIVKERFERGLKYCDRNAEFELKENFMFDREFGLFIETDYGTFESIQFNKELGSLITISLSKFDSLGEAINEYKFFQDFIFEDRNKLIDEFHKQYLVYRDEVLNKEPIEYLEKVCPKLEKKRDVLNLIKYTWLEMFKNEGGEVEYLIGGDTTWDEEHGFRFVINKKREIRTD